MSEVVSLPPGSARKLMQRGEMKRVTVPSQKPKLFETSGSPEKIRLFEKAIHIFGENFLGYDAILLMEEKCKKAGINIEFVLPMLDLPFTDRDLDLCERDIKDGISRLLVLRPSAMKINDNKPLPITLNTLSDVFNDNNPFGDGRIFFDNIWWVNQHFANASLIPGYAMPTKQILALTANLSWNEQETHLSRGEIRRTAIETVWDLILYYAKTGERLLSRTYDWTKTLDFSSRPVYVGGFASTGIFMASQNPPPKEFIVGVCPQR